MDFRLHKKKSKQHHQQLPASHPALAQDTNITSYLTLRGRLKSLNLFHWTEFDTTFSDLVRCSCEYRSLNVKPHIHTPINTYKAGWWSCNMINWLFSRLIHQGQANRILYTQPIVRNVGSRFQPQTTARYNHLLRVNRRSTIESIADL